MQFGISVLQNLKGVATLTDRICTKRDHVKRKDDDEEQDTVIRQCIYSESREYFQIQTLLAVDKNAGAAW
jgi:hypothetical protein